MWPTLLIIVYCTLIVFASLVGGWLPSLLRLTHVRMQLMMSFVGGLMMGVAVLHLLPHAVVQANSLDYAVWPTVLGLLVTFFMIRIFGVHQHGFGDEPSLARVGHGHQQRQQHEAADSCSHQPPRLHRLSWLGIFVGLALHTLIDGVALSASVTASAHEQASVGLFGMETFLVILLHKPLDALSITSVMAAGGWSKGGTNAVNTAFALMCPVGALAFVFGVQSLPEAQHVVVGCALGFAAGVFLCISLADILPEVQFHAHDRLRLSAALLMGVALAYGIGILEPEHAPFQPDTRPSVDVQDHHAK